MGYCHLALVPGRDQRGDYGGWFLWGKSMRKNRITFGIRIPIFKNLGVIVFYAVPSATEQFGAAVEVIRTVMAASGVSTDGIVFEVRPA
jgi:hypothetical protein